LVLQFTCSLAEKDDMPSDTWEIPRFRNLARHAIPRVVEATLIPLGLFYLSLWLIGVWGALLAALAWSYGAVACRLVTRRRVPGILMLGSMALTVRTLVAFASGSVYVYFLQPTLGTIAIAAAFLLSVSAGRPLAERLASDFCPLPQSLLATPAVRRFFMRISLLWALTNTLNAVVTLWLLFSQDLSIYLLAKTLVSWTITGSAIAISTVWFKRSMRRSGVLRGRRALVSHA
jgi:hypothetical protein